MILSIFKQSFYLNFYFSGHSVLSVRRVLSCVPREHNDRWKRLFFSQKNALDLIVIIRLFFVKIQHKGTINY